MCIILIKHGNVQVMHGNELTLPHLLRRVLLPLGEFLSMAQDSANEHFVLGDGALPRSGGVPSHDFQEVIFVTKTGRTDKAVSEKGEKERKREEKGTAIPDHLHLPNIQRMLNMVIP